jgi:hypothetical protein
MKSHPFTRRMHRLRRIVLFIPQCQKTFLTLVDVYSQFCLMVLLCFLPFTSLAHHGRRAYLNVFGRRRTYRTYLPSVQRDVRWLPEDAKLWAGSSNAVP